MSEIDRVAKISEFFAENIKYYSNAKKREGGALRRSIRWSSVLYYAAMVCAAMSASRIEQFFFSDSKAASVIIFLTAFFAGSGYFLSKYIEKRGFLRAWTRYSLTWARLQSNQSAFFMAQAEFISPLSAEDKQVCLTTMQEACKIVEDETAQFVIDATTDFSGLLNMLREHDGAAGKKSPDAAAVSEMP